VGESLAACLVASAAILLAPVAASAGVVPTDQTREIEATATTATGFLCPPPGCAPTSVVVDSDSDEATGFEAFTSSVSPGPTAEVEMDTSELAASVITASGGHSLHSSSTLTFPEGFPFYETVSGVGQSVLEVVFDVDEDAVWCLSGLLSVTGGFAWNSQVGVAFSGPQGELLNEVLATDACFEPPCMEVDPIAIQTCGALPAGSYTLHVDATGSAYTFRFANQLFDGSTTASFDLTLDLDATPPSELPALSAPARWLLIVALGALAAVGSRHARVRWGVRASPATATPGISRVPTEKPGFSTRGSSRAR